jgi:acetate kinase
MAGVPVSRVLVVNPGSSSLKLSVLGPDGAELAAEEIATASGGVAEGELERFLRSRAGSFDAAGVRVVHGGTAFRSPAVVDAAVLQVLEGLSELAPLHNPPAVHALRLLLRALPGTPVVACFDTAFHAQMPQHAVTYAVPWRWTSEFGVRRFGFHGLSHAHAARRCAELLGRRVDELQVVTCHLGAGASLCAVRGGVSVDTTMGFTPMEGLVMATRSGSLDPGALLHVQRRHGVSAADAERMLDRESGLLGVSGVSADMREVLAACAHGDGRAALALDVYVHRLRTSIAAMAASLSRLDALVFTGGVGEHAASIRERACAGLGVLGIAGGLSPLPADAPDGVVSAPGAAVPVLVVRAREDLQIAREVRTLLG